MKVCTDACIQGAYTANYIDQSIKTVLDIGSGTGLLSLMLAQHSSAAITAVEIEESAFRQTEDNFNHSKWKERLTAIHGDILQFKKNHFFDAIICNPPFYENDLASPDDKKNTAMHSSHLPLQNLISAIEELLAQNGFASVMLPYHRKTEFETLIHKTGLFAYDILSVKQTNKHSFFRCIFILGKQQKEMSEQQLVIKENDLYSLRFQQLLQSFYLNL